MSISKDDIKAWLSTSGRDREWLAEQCGSSKNTVNNWLSTNIQVPSKALRIIETLMRADAEVERAKNPAPPMSLVLEVEGKRFDAYNRAATQRGLIIREWAVDILNEAAERDALAEKAAATSNTVPFAVAGTNDELQFWIDRRGGIAAGSPIDAVNWEPIPVGKKYPEDHYALKVFGESMAPKIPDGSTIIVREVPDNTFPKQGTIVVYSDANGSTLKVLAYRPAKAGEEANAFGKVPILKSLNPQYSEVKTMEGGRIDAVLIEVL